MSFCSVLTNKMRTLINPEIKVGGSIDYPEVYIPLKNKEVFEKVKKFLFERGYVYQDCGQSNDLQYMICTFKKGLNYKSNVTKINESQLRKIIKESIQNVLEESGYTSEDINNAFQQWQRRGVSSKYKLPQYENFNNAIMNANTLLSKANQLWQYLNKEDIKSASLTLQPISDLLERIEGDLMKYNQQTAQQQGQQGMSNQQRQYNQQQNMYGQY